MPLRAPQSDNGVFRVLLGRGWLRWFALPSSGAVCGGHALLLLLTRCICSWVFKSGSWILSLFVSCCASFAPIAHVISYF